MIFVGCGSAKVIPPLSLWILLYELGFPDATGELKRANQAVDSNLLVDTLLVGR